MVELGHEVGRRSRIVSAPDDSISNGKSGDGNGFSRIVGTCPHDGGQLRCLVRRFRRSCCDDRLDQLELEMTGKQGRLQAATAGCRSATVPGLKKLGREERRPTSWKPPGIRTDCRRPYLFLGSPFRRNEVSSSS